jgi:hypothetical protein
MQFDVLNFAKGTIRPGMLEYNTGYDLGIDSILFNGDVEGHMGIL